MKIDHIAMYVSDLEETRHFFENYFGAEANQGYYNEKTGFRSYFLTFEDGARLEIMKRPRMDDLAKTPNRTGYVHLAFSAGSPDQVDALTARLKADGFPVISGPRTTGDGYYESCLIGIEENLIEITV